MKLKSLVAAAFAVACFAAPATAGGWGHGHYGGYYEPYYDYYPGNGYGYPGGSCGGCGGGFYNPANAVAAAPVAINIANNNIQGRRRHGCGGYGCGYPGPRPYYNGCGGW